MAGVVKPSSEAELAEIIATAEAPFEVVGSGTRHGIGRRQAEKLRA